MGIMVYSLLWVVQDFVHQQLDTPKNTNLHSYYVCGLGFRVLIIIYSPKYLPES